MRGRESRVLPIVPGHGASAFVAVRENASLPKHGQKELRDETKAPRKRIAGRIARHRMVRQPELVSVVDEGHSAHSHLKRGKKPRTGKVVAEPFHLARSIVVTEHVGRMQGLCKNGFELADELTKRRCTERCTEALEQEHEVQTLARRAAVFSQQLGRTKHLPDDEAPRVLELIDHAAELACKR